LNIYLFDEYFFKNFLRIFYFLFYFHKGKKYIYSCEYLYHRNYIFNCGTKFKYYFEKIIHVNFGTAIFNLLILFFFSIFLTEFNKKKFFFCNTIYIN